MSSSDRARELRAKLASGQLVIAPGCGDALSGRLIQEAGFELAFMSGFWTAATRGMLDIGLIGLTEMSQNARYITQALTIPLICDADTGFSDGFVHVGRCVQEFENAGAAGITLEDQTLLKRCGLREHKPLVSTEAMVAKLRAALASRSNRDFVIVARTDSLEAEGTAGAIDRGRAYLECGADLLFVEGFRSDQEVYAVAEEFPARKLIFNQAPPGYGPQIPLADLDRLGFAICLFPAHLALAAMTVQRQLLHHIRSGQPLGAFAASLTPVDDFSQLLGEEDAAALEANFGDRPTPADPVLQTVRGEDG
jgi:2-methylisocitrate lyase-like PEP mutase family enzyme